MLDRPHTKDYRTHVRLTRSFFPQYDEATIRRVQQAIDVPSSSDIMYNNLMQGFMGPNFGMLEGMNKAGHRKYNHDMFSAMMKGYQVAGIDGAVMGVQHLFEDTLNDVITRSMGRDYATLIETMFLLSTNKNNKRRR
jgi:hypothetical protein